MFEPVAELVVGGCTGCGVAGMGPGPDGRGTATVVVVARAKRPGHLVLRGLFVVARQKCIRAAGVN